MKTFTIYAIRRERDGKEYVGCTTTSLRRRIAGHLSSPDSSVGKDMRSEGIEGFTIRGLEVLRGRKVADLAERKWIRHLGCLFPAGYNIEIGGIRAPMSEITKAKLRGRVFSAEHRRKLSEIAKRRIPTRGQLKALEIGRRAKKPGLKGSSNPHALLDEEKVRSIRRLLEAGKHSQEKIGAMFGVHQITISTIATRKTWRHI